MVRAAHTGPVDGHVSAPGPGPDFGTAEDGVGSVAGVAIVAGIAGMERPSVLVHGADVADGADSVDGTVAVEGEHARDLADWPAWTVDGPVR